ncbi:hypothetical protein EYF80_013763 [Liparis tanakae]|uniref:Uncharacterized protein n=1 Tax=Liparis tanakae TaxID=230148 RepID=A0A4Z2IDF6_9TELE|nr:hypothetical protein EYF80_013763 [Liparis tanakae]
MVSEGNRCPTSPHLRRLKENDSDSEEPPSERKSFSSCDGYQRGVEDGEEVEVEEEEEGEWRW